MDNYGYEYEGEENEEMPITIRSAKSKGMRLQKYICQQIADLFGIKFDNQNDNSLIQSRTCGLSGVDIILRDFIYKRFTFDIECKNQEKINIKEAIRQAKNNTKENRNWLLFWKCKEFKKPVVIMDSEIFFEIMKKNIF